MVYRQRFLEEELPVSEHYRACPASRGAFTAFGDPQVCDCDEIERDRHEAEREAWVETGRDNAWI